MFNIKQVFTKNMFPKPNLKKYHLYILSLILLSGITFSIIQLTTASPATPGVSHSPDEITPGSFQNGTYIFPGKVGIGTTEAPTKTLEVNGSIKGTQLCIGGDCRSEWEAVNVYKADGVTKLGKFMGWRSFSYKDLIDVYGFADSDDRHYLGKFNSSICHGLTYEDKFGNLVRLADYDCARPEPVKEMAFLQSNCEGRGAGWTWGLGWAVDKKVIKIAGKYFRFDSCFSGRMTANSTLYSDGTCVNRVSYPPDPCIFVPIDAPVCGEGECEIKP